MIFSFSDFSVKHQDSLRVGFPFNYLTIFPSPALSGSGSMGMISARSQLLILLKYLDFSFFKSQVQNQNSKVLYLFLGILNLRH